MSASLWDDLPVASVDGLLSTEECFMLLDADFNDGWYLYYNVLSQIKRQYELIAVDGHVA